MSKVQLYVYEVTKGLASQLSTAFLGRHIPGVWHTGVVCFGMEYFFGSGGIQNIRPGTTIVGAPDEIIDLGETQITDDLFHEFLFTISNDRFRPECYHLFDHNCNTFSNEVAQFLTGNTIPSHILDLPNDVANTPIGAMLKTFMDGFGSPIGGQANQLSRPSSRSQQQSHQHTMQQGPRQTSMVARTTERSNPTDSTPVVFNYDVDECCKRIQDSFAINPAKTELIIQFVKGRQGIENRITEIIEALYLLLKFVEDNKETEKLVLFIDIISIIALKSENDVFSSQEGIQLVNQVIRLCNENTAVNNKMFQCLKLGANLYSDRKRRELLIESQNEAHSSVTKSFTAYIIESLVGQSNDKDTENATVSLAYNMSLSKMNEEAALELASALLHWISSAKNDSQSGKLCLAAVRHLTKWNHQIKDLAEMTIDPKLLE